MKRDTERPAGCACAVHGTVQLRRRRTGGAARDAAAGVDPEAKARNTKRLRRIEGQVRGLERMIDEDRCCTDVMTQIAAVHEALRGVGREIMRNHLRHCAATASDAGGENADLVYDELVELMYRSAR